MYSLVGGVECWVLLQESARLAGLAGVSCPVLHMHPLVHSGCLGWAFTPFWAPDVCRLCTCLPMSLLLYLVHAAKLVLRHLL